MTPATIPSWGPSLSPSVLPTLLLILALTTLPVPASAQTAPSLATLTARYGWEPTGGRDAALGIGFELELRPQGTVVPTVRYDRWEFGIACVGLDPCPSGVGIWSLGGTVRGGGTARLVPFTGADVGSMRWTSGAKGVSVRLRSGLDVRLARAVGLTFDLGYVRFLQESAGRGRMLQDGILGVSGGVRVGY